MNTSQSREEATHSDMMSEIRETSQPPLSLFDVPDAGDIEAGHASKEQPVECMRDGDRLHGSSSPQPSNNSYGNTDDSNLTKDPACQSGMESDEDPARHCPEDATRVNGCQPLPEKQTFNIEMTEQSATTFPVRSPTDNELTNEDGESTCPGCECPTKPGLSDVKQCNTASTDPSSCTDDKGGKVSVQSHHSNEQTRGGTMRQGLVQTCGYCRPKYHIFLCVQMSFLLMCPLFYAVAVAAMAAIACFGYCFCCILMV